EVPLAKSEKREAVTNGVVASEYSGDAPAGSPVRNIDEDSFGPVTAVGAAELRIQPAGEGAHGGDHEQCEQAEAPHGSLFLVRGSADAIRALSLEVVAQQNGGGDVVNRCLGALAPRRVYFGHGLLRLPGCKPLVHQFHVHPEFLFLHRTEKRRLSPPFPSPPG